MLGRIENFFRKLRRRISRSEWIVALLHLPVSKDAQTEPGLILIQIDGLARRQMECALENGRLPFLRRLIERENYQTRTFYSGLPASTPAVQAELFYGVRHAVPAFSFLNRHARRVFAMFDADCAKKVEADISRRGDGLLRGGSSWSNIYTGGAKESHFCASQLERHAVFQWRRVAAAVLFPLLHFPTVARMLALWLAEFLAGIGDLCRAVFCGEPFLMELRLLISRIFICIGLREYLTVGVKIDAARGLPVIHANFIGYDTYAHRRGPASAPAHWSLRGIDRAIKKIYRAAQRSGRRDYQVWIYSDHGQEKTELFTRDGQRLDEVIRNLLDGFDSAAQPRAHRPRCVHPHAYLLRKGSDRIVEGYQENSVCGEEQWFSLAAMGSIGHLYLIHPQARAQKFQLAERLVRQGGIPGVLLCGGDGKFEWRRDGASLSLPEDAAKFLPHPGELKNEVARDLADLCRQKCAGDIVLLGWNADKSPVSFVDEHGAHAGPGPEETQGFALLPLATKLPESMGEFLRPTDLRAAALHFLGRQPLPPRKLKKSAAAKMFRVMTYNVHGCRGMDGRISTARIARVIEEFQPDIIALQELDFGRVRSRHHDQPALIAAALGMTAQFCPTIIDRHGQYGHAILSRGPMKIFRAANFGNAAPDFRRNLVAAPRRHHQRIEPRGALWVKLEIAGQPLHLMNTHFGLRGAERRAQAAELLGAHWIGQIPGAPLILCGDFNMIPHSAPYHAMTQRLRDAQAGLKNFRPLKTYSTLHPFTRIDHIFVSEHFVVEKILAPRNDLTRVASDHLPLIADLRWREI